MNGIARLGALCLFSLFAAGGGKSGKLEPTPAEVSHWTREGANHLAGGRPGEAARAYLRGAEVARASRDARRQSLFLNAAAGAHFSGHEYTEADRNYREAAHWARVAGETTLEAVACLNLGSLSISLWDPEAGEQQLERAAALLSPDSEYWPRLLALRMYLAALRNEPDTARHWGRMAGEASDSAGQTALTTQIWDKLGDVALREGRFDEAERYLLASFRLRRLGALPNLESSYRALARLYLAQGRIEEAGRLSEAAQAARAASPSASAPWWGHHERALVLRAQGRTGEAIEEARKAVAGAVGWRNAVLSAQWMQSAADVTAAEAAAHLVDLLMERGGEGSAREALLAVEATRATALRAAAWRNRWQHERTPEFQAPAGTVRLRTAALSPAPLPDGNATPETPVTSATLRAMLAPGEAYLSFLAGEDVSWGWILTRDSFTWGPLPGRETLAAQIGAIRSTLQNDEPGWQELITKQVRSWLPWAGTAAWQARNWRISADGALFHFPWAAVAAERPVTMVPVLAFRTSRPTDWNGGGIAAFGDPVYNRADARSGPVRPRTGNPPLELPRLVGSGSEIRKVSVAARRARWVVDEYTGAAASMPGLTEALERRPSVVHIAAHFFEGPAPVQTLQLARAPGRTRDVARPREVLLAFSLDRNGSVQLLNSSEVAGAFHVPDSVIVLSGCGSGSGDDLPGAGLLGFTHAWLAAGARAVVATLWPVADDTGEFFEAFYDHLLAGEPAGASLAGARTVTLSQGDWRARPSAWAGYFTMGKE